MKKGLFISLLLLTAVWACEEPNITSQNEPRDPDNVRLSVIPFYGDSAMVTDTAYLTDQGELFYFDSLKVLASNLMFIPVQSDDTVSADMEYELMGPPFYSDLIDSIPPGGYNGKFILTLGVDSFPVGPNGSMQVPLKLTRNEELKLPFGFGYYHFLLYGKVVTSAPTDTVEETEEVRWKIGGLELNDTVYAQTTAFSVDNQNEMRLVLTCNLKDALGQVFIENNPVITSDPSDFQDFQRAQLIRDTLEFGLF